jgi:hypothetical protein
MPDDPNDPDDPGNDDDDMEDDDDTTSSFNRILESPPLGFTELVYASDLPISIDDLPICHRLSHDITDFCIHYLRAPPRTQKCIPDLNTFHLSDILDRVLMVIHHGHYHPGESPIADHVNYVLNLATRFTMRNLTDDEKGLFDEKGGHLPTTFRHLLVAEASRSYEIANTIICCLIYGLKSVYLVHKRNYPGDNSEVAHLYYAKTFVDAIKETYTTATVIDLFSDEACFSTIPWFLNDLFQTTTILPKPDQMPDDHYPYIDLTRDVIHIESNLYHIKKHLDEYVDAFHTSPYKQRVCTKTAKHLVKQAILHHGCIQRKLTTERKEQPFLPQQIQIGNLPPTDFILSHFCSAFPMLTHRTPQQCRENANQTYPGNLSTSFVICEPLTEDALITYHDDKLVTHREDSYSSQKQLHTPLPTNRINDSIDFLPPSEFCQFNVVKTVDEKDPFNRFGRNTKKVLVYQGFPLYCPNYTSATPTECAIPGEHAHKFPISYTEEHFPSTIILIPMRLTT